MLNKINSKKYEEMVKKESSDSTILKNCIFAFLAGGLICVIGEGMFNSFIFYGLDELTSRTVTSVTLIAIAAILTMFHAYDDLAKHAGAGTVVPITGFSNSVVSPAIEFKSEGIIMGTGSKMFIIAGPVIVYGLSASFLYGLIIYIFNLY